MDEIKAWEKMPQETAKAFRAFQVYLGIIDHANPARQTRSVRKVCEIMGVKPTSVSGVELWSQKYNWVARAAAFDAHMAHNIIVFKETGLAEYQAEVVGSLTQQLVVLDEIINRQLAAMREEIIREKSVDPAHIKRMVEAVRDKDDLARRVGKMPTAFLTEKAADVEEEFIYTVGSGDE